MTAIRLYDFFRSSASYRVRIALNLKGLAYESEQISLPAGEHRSEANLARNHQGFVPTLEIDGLQLTQSLAIIEYLDTRFPEPRFIPAGPVERARVMAQALLIAADIHPVNNLRILNYLKNTLGVEENARNIWYRHWVQQGFDALEIMAAGAGTFLGGEKPGLADICLVPQMFNARRFDTPLDAYPTLVRIDAACQKLPAFADAHPDIVVPTA